MLTLFHYRHGTLAKINIEKCIWLPPFSTGVVVVYYISPELHFPLGSNGLPNSLTKWIEKRKRKKQTWGCIPSPPSPPSLSNAIWLFSSDDMNIHQNRSHAWRARVPSQKHVNRSRTAWTPYIQTIDKMYSKNEIDYLYKWNIIFFQGARIWKITGRFTLINIKAKWPGSHIRNTWFLSTFSFPVGWFWLLF